jgi:heavy metal sensor kinase
MHLNIRWRLTLWNTIAVACVLVGLGALVYGLLARALYERVDQSLVVVWHEVERQSDPNLPHWIEEAKEHQNVFCVVYTPDGRVYARTEELPEAGTPPPPELAPVGADVATATLPIIGRQRVLSRRLSWQGKDWPVLVFAPLEEVDNQLRQLLSVLVVAVPVCLAAAGGLGYLLARKALAPMERLHRLTEEITADRLDRRLPVADPHDELGHLTRTINAMIARLERSFAEIRRFTADASHELRTPLTAIRTEAEVALGKSLAAADYQHLLGSILEECERLTRLTDQLLALSREEAGVARPVREPVDVGALVGRVTETMRPLADAKGLDLRWEPTANGRLVPGDETRLREVFYNVLDNAIKYTPPGGRIVIRLVHQDRAAVVTLRDTGIGIAAEHLARVFDRFYRVDKGRSREQGGTGLGLSIAKTIVAAHGGRIELESSPGQGTTCTVTLPELAGT